MHIQGQEPLTASLLAAAPPQEQKQMIGGCQAALLGQVQLQGLGACGLACTRADLIAGRSCKALWDCFDIMLL